MVSLCVYVHKDSLCSHTLFLSLMAHPVDDLEYSSGRGPSSGKGLDFRKGVSQKEATEEDHKEDLSERRGRVISTSALTNVFFFKF